MDLGDLGASQDVDTRVGLPSEGGEEREGTREIAEGGGGRGHGDTFRAGGRREAAICLPWRLPQMQTG